MDVEFGQVNKCCTGCIKESRCPRFVDGNFEIDDNFSLDEGRVFVVGEDGLALAFGVVVDALVFSLEFIFEATVATDVADAFSLFGSVVENQSAVSFTASLWQMFVKVVEDGVGNVAVVFVTVDA